MSGKSSQAAGRKLLLNSIFNGIYATNHPVSVYTGGWQSGTWGIISACLVKNAARSIGEGCDCAFQLPILMDYKPYSIRDFMLHINGQNSTIIGG